MWLSGYWRRCCEAVRSADDDYTEGMIGAIRFLWSATRGHRWAPWTSPYLKWRLETYSGMAAETITAKDFLQFTWRERRQLGRFLLWAGEMRGHADAAAKQSQ